MIDRIRDFLDSAFESAPQTAKVQELKEELFANLVDKYNDQLRQGRAPEEAYQIVIGGIGDLDELIASVPVSYTHLWPICGPVPCTTIRWTWSLRTNC